MFSLSERLKDIEEHLLKDYALLKEYEDALRLESDPQHRAKLQHQIGELKKQIQPREVERDTLRNASERGPGGFQEEAKSSNLVPQLDVPGTKKLVPKSNLKLLGIEYCDLYLDGNNVYREIRRGETRQVQPSHSVVLRFGNEPIKGQPGQPIRDLRAQLRFLDVKTDQQLRRVDRGLWVQEKYSSITLPVGDTRLLQIGFGLPKGFENPGIVLMVANNYYRQNEDGDHVVQGIERDRLQVEVRLVAGDGGYIMYESSFDLITRPRLVLSELTD